MTAAKKAGREVALKNLMLQLERGTKRVRKGPKPIQLLNGEFIEFMQNDKSPFPWEREGYYPIDSSAIEYRLDPITKEPKLDKQGVRIPVRLNYLPLTPMEISTIETQIVNLKHKLENF